nr:PREDICTED: bcl-2-like protein 10 [Bos indicus]
MVDPFRERTARLLMDYLEFCAREPGTPAPAPSTPEAARPPQTTRRQKRDDDGVSRDCRLLVALLCAQFCERHRAWLMANGGWDGFCLFFSQSFQPSWERQLVWFFLAYWTAIIIIYFWIKLL